jgi:hypothetical protein
MMMRAETLLHRQIHPDFVQESRVSSQAFRPTPDDNLMSVYHGDLIAPVDSWTHYTATLQLTSAGVRSLSVAECQQASLPARPDPGTFREHAVVDFQDADRKEIKRRSKILARLADARGWQHRVSGEQEEG